MLLTPYRNPPFRLPRMTQDPLQRAAKPDSETPSPKRKRGSSIPRPGLEISTPLHELQTLADERCESPRNAVAKGLEALDLRNVDPGVPVPVPGRDGDVGGSALMPRKRLKASGCAVHPTRQELNLGRQGSGTPGRGSDGTEGEIAETPDCRVDRRVGSSQPASPLPQGERPMGVPVLDGMLDERLVSHSPLPHHPPIASSSQTTSNHSTDSQDSLDQVALTWQDSEITGHDIDSTSPDDDGEGINGIGFKPTPAMAYARSQRRKQQVNEWRAREAREARQKRAQKRQGGSSDGEGVDAEGGKRAVRFAEVG